MKIGKFILRIFTVIGIVTTVSIALGSASAWYWLSRPAPQPKAPSTMLLELDFTKPVVEQGGGMAFPLAYFLEEEEETPFFDIIRAIDRARKDDRVKGIVARLGTGQPNLTHVQEIRDALMKFRESGKFTYVFAPSYGSFGLGNRAYYLASAFENIWLQPVGTVGLTGLGMEAPFGKKALEQIGVKADFMRREEYKSVMENVTRDDFSAPVRANMESILGNLEGQLVSGIAASRKQDAATVQAWMKNGPYTASEALTKNIVTRIGYFDEMLDMAELLGTAPETKDSARVKPELVDPSSYLVYSHKDTKPKATVAFIRGIGMITDAPVGPSGFGEDRVINTEKLVQAFEDAASDDSVKAILFRVDSPGGSPDASETIRHALVKAQEAKKPVFVSMGDTAASGGYWIAMNADHIVAAPGTLTGSIGVAAGKFVVEGLMQKLGVGWERLSTSENAHMWSMTRPFTPEGIERMNVLLDDTYGAFTRNVAAARKIPMDKIPEVAKGRVWTGEQALKTGLVDELGGVMAAVASIKKHLKLEQTDTIELKTFPEPETPMTLAIRLLKNLGLESAFLRQAMPLFRSARSAAGPLWYDLIDTNAVSARIPSAFLQEIN